jgi:hypothetical protein
LLVHRSGEDHMTQYPASISEYGSTEPFELQVARGQIDGHRSVVIFGYNPDVDLAEVTVWPLQSIKSHPAAAVQLKVSSTSASDTSNGTGARTVTIYGLDGSWNEITETVTLSGQTAVTTTNSFLRIQSAVVATAGSSTSAVGDIYFGEGTVTAGVPATIYDIIKYDYNKTITGHYTIPAKHTGYLMQGLFSAGQPSGTSQVIGRLLTTPEDGIRRAAAITAVNNGVADYAFEFPVPIPEKTDVEATAVGRSVNNEASCMFIILLVRNG